MTLLHGPDLSTLEARFKNTHVTSHPLLGFVFMLLVIEKSEYWYDQNSCVMFWKNPSWDLISVKFNRKKSSVMDNT